MHIENCKKINKKIANLFPFIRFQNRYLDRQKTASRKTDRQQISPHSLDFTKVWHSTLFLHNLVVSKFQSGIQGLFLVQKNTQNVCKSEANFLDLIAQMGIIYSFQVSQVFALRCVTSHFLCKKCVIVHIEIFGYIIRLILNPISPKFVDFNGLRDMS